MKKLFLSLLLVGAVAAAAETPTYVDKIAEGRDTFELGLVAGLPTVVGVELGWWNIGGTPLLWKVTLGGAFFRFGGPNASDTFQYGVVSTDFGWIVVRHSRFKQWVGISGGIAAGASTGFAFAGASWGFHFSKALSATIGPAIYFSDRESVFPLPYGKIGATWFF